MALPEAEFRKIGDVVSIAAGTAREGGDVVQIRGSTMAGVIVRDMLTTADPGEAYTRGIFDCVKATGDSFTIGDALDWDDSANTVVAAGTGTHYLGLANETIGTGVLKIEVALNAQPPGQSILLNPRIKGHIFDEDGNEILGLNLVASAVNEIDISNAATGNRPIISTDGEVDIGLEFHNDQGEEMLRLIPVATAINQIDIRNAATTARPIISTGGEADIGIEFHNDQAEQMLILVPVATAVNEVTITNAATGNSPSVSATGETNTGIDVITKGTGAGALVGDDSDAFAWEKDTNVKIAFHGATRVVKHATTGNVTGFSAESGTASKSDSTWDGASGSTSYTVGDIVTAMKALGLMTA